MFTIDKQFETSRQTPARSTPGSDATQRVNLNAGSSRPANPSRRPSGKHNRKISQKDKIILITIISLTLILLILLGVALAKMFQPVEDDGLILNNVIAAGVNLGGMTPEQATDALNAATANTYTQLEMIVTVVDTTISLSPADTGANLDVAGVVNEAYNYGRTGSRSEQQQAKTQSLTTPYIIDIIPYLNLDTDYIKTEVNSLGITFSSILSQPTISISGEQPSMDVAKPDTSVVHQTLTIYVGTAEYGLDTNRLYEQILEYYNINIFQVVGQCSVVTPDSLDEKLEALYEEYCVAPVDAQMDMNTYYITPEIYGYGFRLEEVKEQIANAPYGTTLEISLTYLEPAITEELLSNGLFKDVLGEFYAQIPADDNWKFNVLLACQKLNGTIIKSGEEFSFNALLGELTEKNGWKSAETFLGKKLTDTLGGGATQVASVLYNCVRKADLEIVEHQHHTYVATFMEIGQDVFTDGENSDFRFRNTLPDPICIYAEVVGDTIEIRLVGTESREYQVEIEYLTVATITPGTLTNLMTYDNPGNHKNGDILVTPLLGYTVEVYRYTYDGTTGQQLSQDLIETITYSARDKVVVKLQPKKDPTPTIPSQPTNPSQPTDPSTSTAPSTSTPDPTEVTAPTQPSGASSDQKGN